MQINRIQGQSNNNYEPAFNARLKVANKKLIRPFKKMIKKESKLKREEFNLLFERFSGLHQYDTLNMDIVFNQATGLEELKVNRIGSAVDLYVPIMKNNEYMYPLTRILKETIENPSLKAMWEV